jgi:hypothetical protein
MNRSEWRSINPDATLLFVPNKSPAVCLCRCILASGELFALNSRHRDRLETPKNSNSHCPFGQVGTLVSLADYRTAPFPAARQNLDSFSDSPRWGRFFGSPKKEVGVQFVGSYVEYRTLCLTPPSRRRNLPYMEPPSPPPTPLDKDPLCLRCGGTMRFSCTEEEKPGFAHHVYECKKCRSTQSFVTPV